jgi:hypothetical protein
VESAELSLAQIELRKDTVVAAFQSAVSRWHGVQGAGLAAAGLGVVTYAGGSLASLALLVVVTIAALLVVLGVAMIAFHNREFAEAVETLLDDIETLKRTGGTS